MGVWHCGYFEFIPIQKNFQISVQNQSMPVKIYLLIIEIRYNRLYNRKKKNTTMLTTTIFYNAQYQENFEFFVICNFSTTNKPTKHQLFIQFRTSYTEKHKKQKNPINNYQQFPQSIPPIPLTVIVIVPIPLPCYYSTPTAHHHTLIIHIKSKLQKVKNLRKKVKSFQQVKRYYLKFQRKQNQSKNIKNLNLFLKKFQFASKRNFFFHSYLFLSSKTFNKNFNFYNLSIQKLTSFTFNSTNNKMYQNKKKLQTKFFPTTHLRTISQLQRRETFIILTQQGIYNSNYNYIIQSYIQIPNFQQRT
eukprot:TRINITY_DN7883_c1_g1_i9.p1 TRINITY_DN7883_c1_g1~~TRINITY_DN7883_c1_g1_i9.p1  ORF type:complete len:303 (-),score=-25.48 TRINITY_DN7883_c1_g1_i9:190-1098(-)